MLEIKGEKSKRIELIELKETLRTTGIDVVINGITVARFYHNGKVSIWEGMDMESEISGRWKE